MYIVYKTINKQNGKFYIGQHKRDGRNYLGSGKILKDAILKYGRESFNREILEYCDTKDKVNEREIYWIDKLKPYYNISDGGTGGDMFTDNPNKEKIRKNYSMAKKNVKKSEEHKQKIRDSVKKYWGHKHTEKTKKLISKKSSIAMKEVWKRRKQNES